MVVRLVLGGDFRQVMPIVEGAQILISSIIRSPLSCMIGIILLYMRITMEVVRVAFVSSPNIESYIVSVQLCVHLRYTAFS